jgi:hypothetical protein
MERQQTDYVEELAQIARDQFDASVNTTIYKALDAHRCPECDDSGIAVEYDLETEERWEIKCECGAEVIGRFFCAWCKRILERCEAPGETGGICQECLAFFTAMGKGSDEDNQAVPALA